MAKKEAPISMVDSFAEFKELKNIDKTTMISVLEESFRNVLAKMFGSDENFVVIMNPDKGDCEIYQNLEVVADGAVEKPSMQIALSEAREIDPECEIGEEVTKEINFEKFGRRAILTLRQTLASKILDLQKDAIYNKFKAMEGEIVTGEVYQGMKEVPVNLIVGSEGRYHDFDNHFFPKNAHLKNRWASIDQAHLQDVVLPPVKLYELGGVYFVRDGNHRVSVAKSKGIECVDAEVVSLQSELKLKPGSTQKQMMQQVIQYEKRVFYAETAFGDITDYWNLDFSVTGQYDVIFHHLLIHKYYINQNQSDEISMQEAILSWFNTVYMPVINTIKRQHIMRRFKHRTPADMYVWIIKYWDDLKKKFGNDVSLDQAAEDFTKKFGTNILRKLIAKLKNIGID